MEIPDPESSPPGLPSGERNEPPEIDAELAARIERAARELDERLQTMRDELEGLEEARDNLAELLEDG